MTRNAVRRWSIASSLCTIACALAIFASECQAESIFDDNPTPAPHVVAPKPNPTTLPTPQNAGAPTAESVRHPVPDRAGRADARKTLEEAYAAELKDHSPAGMRKLFNDLLTDARKDAVGSPEQFVLYSGAVQVAEQAHSLRRAFAAIDGWANVFDIDPLALKTSAVTKTCEGGPPSAIWTIANVEELLSLADESVAQNNSACLSEAESALRRSLSTVPDPDLRAEVSDELRTVAAVRETRDRIAPDIAKLETSPNDPSANFAVGSYLCFLDGRWEQGLPMLAKSGDPQLAPLAAAELSRPTDATTIAKLADQWFTIADKRPLVDRPQIMQHAAKLYCGCRANLSGLQAKLADDRLAKIPPGRLERIDLIDLFEPATGVLKGDWELQESSLASGTASYFARVDFPYRPSDEYDFRVGFTVMSKPKGAVVPLGYCAGHQFALQVGGWHNTIVGFEMIGSHGANHNATTRKRDAWLVQGRHYILVLKVRSDHADAYLDGQLITTMKTDYSDLHPWGDWHLSRADDVGIGADNIAVRYDLAEIVEVTGKGAYLSTESASIDPQ